MNFDIFAALAEPASSIAVHNIRLLDVQQGEAGYERLIIEHAGSTRQLVGGGRWNQDHSRRNVGKVGYLVSAWTSDRDLPVGACYFRDYIDQSLRRVPELDDHNRVSNDGCMSHTVGWYCDVRPLGFRAPAGIIPGIAGRFVPDETVAVTLRVPPEFVRECRRVQMSPEALLRSFVGDLAGIQSYIDYPRADRYSSNGSDEREYADAWLNRAHGFNAIDLNALEASEDEAEQKQFQRDDLTDLLDDFESHGGNPDDLIRAVQALVDKQAKVEGN